MKILGAVLDWYEAQPVGGIDRAALAHYRRLFEARYPDFVDFEQNGGGYAKEERHYKDQLISLARAATSEPESAETWGGRLLDILVGRGGAASNLLGFRTNMRIAEIRSAFPGKLELAIGKLASAEDISAAIADCVEQIWPILSEGQASKPYSESRNIPTMVAALLRPTDAYGVNTEPLQNSAKALVGRKLFGWNAMTADEYREALSMARMNVVDAATEAEQFVTEWVASGSIIELLGTIRHRLSVIYHELQDEASVYRVFEVLNSRGLDVRWIDKTKSQLLASIYEFVDEGSRADSLHEQKTIWQDIYRYLGLEEGIGDEALRFAGTLKCRERPNRVLSDRDASLAIHEMGGESVRSLSEAGKWLKSVVRTVVELRRQATGTDLNEAQWSKVWATDPSKSIEHILPQSSGKGFVHDLGNLTMLPPGVNSSLKDKPPKSKAKRYTESGLEITMAVGRQIIQDGTWNKLAVRARGEAIGEFIRNEWAE